LLFGTRTIEVKISQKIPPSFGGVTRYIKNVGVVLGYIKTFLGIRDTIKDTEKTINKQLDYTKFELPTDQQDYAASLQKLFTD